MDKQLRLSALRDELSQVRTKKREFLGEIEHIVPWEKWISIIKPHYYKAERGNTPYDLERMLRIYLVQNLYREVQIHKKEKTATEARLSIAKALSAFLHPLAANDHAMSIEAFAEEDGEIMAALFQESAVVSYYLAVKVALFEIHHI